MNSKNLHEDESEMKNTKLIQLLSSLKKTEIKSLKKWLKFSLPEGSRANELFEYLEPFYPDFEKLPASQEKISEQIIPGKPFHASSFRNIVSDLLNSIEEHIVWMNLKSKPLSQDYLLLGEYYNRDVEDLFQMRLKSSRALLKESKEPTLSNSLNSFLIDEQEYAYVYFKTAPARQKAFKTFPSEKILRSLNRMFLTRYLYYYAIGLDNERMFGISNIINSAESKLVLELAQDYKDDVFIQTRLLLIQLTQKETKETFPQLTKLLASAEFKNQHAEEKVDVIATCYNYVQKLYVKGEESRLPQLIQMLDFSLEHEAPIRKGKISESFFCNYVFFNLMVNNVSKTVKFINEHKKMLQQATAESATNYTLAQVEFHKKNYDKVLQLLRNVHSANPQRFLGIKNLLLKAYFEKEEFENISGIIDTVRHKLINEEYFSKENILAQKNFIKFLLQLVSFCTQQKVQKKEVLNDLLGKLKKTEFVNHKDWLIAKFSS
ncbi:MAG: hypothetical protein IAF38_16220 [Bacteroidia bacterium]|nr:hypothetical protein [Bacteroidia bacterium]